MQGKIVQLVPDDKKVQKRTPQTEDSGALVHETADLALFRDGI
jgi:hypothetical protein